MLLNLRRCLHCALLGRMMLWGMRGVLILIFIVGFWNKAVSQKAFVAGYYNYSSVTNSNGSPRNEWTELLIQDDNINLQGFTIRDNNGSQDSWQTPISFNNATFWNNLRAGTIIVIWHRQVDTALVNHPTDIIKSDGYIELYANNTTYFNGGSFGNSPDWAGNTLNISNSGDIIELRDASGNHIHCLGHKGPAPGTSFAPIALPKLNLTKNLAASSKGNIVFICPGTDSTYYGYVAPQSGTTFVDTVNNSNFKGIPASCATGATTVSDFWRKLRQPKWTNPAMTANYNSNAGTIALSWNASVDLFPADNTQGYMILRNSTNSFTAPQDGHTYALGNTIGSATVVGIIPSSLTTSFTDNNTILCGQNTFYRVYAYRYTTDDQKWNDYNLARGRAYNESNFAAASASGPAAAIPPTSASVNPNTPLCANDAGTLVLTVSGGSGTGIEWFEDACGSGNLIGTTASITIPSPNTTTTYYVRYNIPGCPPSSCIPVTVTVIGLPTPAEAGEDQSKCGVLTASLEGNQPTTGTGTWSQVSGSGTATIGNSSQYNSNVTVPVNGTYVFRWTIGNGIICPNSFDEVTIVFGTSISVIASSNSPVCTGDTLELYSSIAGATASWTGPNGYSSIGQNQFIPGATTVIAGTYTVNVSGIPGGCPNSSNQTIVAVNISPVAPVSITANPLNVCSNDPSNITLTAIGGSGSVLEWFTDNCGENPIGSGSPLIIPSPTSTTTYYAHWASTTCGSSACASKTVTVDNPPTTANAGNAQAICVLSTTLSGNMPIVGSGAWRKISGPGVVTFQDSTVNNTSVTVSLPGIYILRWTISNGTVCSPSFDDVSIIFNTPQSVSASSNSPLCPGSDINLTASTVVSFLKLGQPYKGHQDQNIKTF